MPQPIYMNIWLSTIKRISIFQGVDINSILLQKEKNCGCFAKCLDSYLFQSTPPTLVSLLKSAPQLGDRQKTLLITLPDPRA